MWKITLYGNEYWCNITFYGNVSLYGGRLLYMKMDTGATLPYTGRLLYMENDRLVTSDTRN